MIDPKQVDDKKVEIHQEVNQQKEFKLIGHILLRPGMSLWCCDLQSGEIEKVIIDRKPKLVYNENGGHDHKIESKAYHQSPNHVYLQAINSKNAIKKFKKSGVQNAKLKP